MKINTVTLLMFLVIPNIGCAKTAEDFEMTVEKVEELKGVILKGIAISGPVKSGCIANEDAYSVKRGGEKVLESTARILDVKKKDGTKYAGSGAAVKGDVVHLYIPDMHEADVRLGDTAGSSTALCGQAAPQK